MTKHPDALTKRAHALMKADHAPAEKLPDYIERARELMAIEANQSTAEIPVAEANRKLDARPYGQPIEEVEALRNQGEFPGMTDQGEDRIPDKKNFASDK